MNCWSAVTYTEFAAGPPGERAEPTDTAPSSERMRAPVPSQTTTDEEGSRAEEALLVLLLLAAPAAPPAEVLCSPPKARNSLASCRKINAEGVGNGAGGEAAAATSDFFAFAAAEASAASRTSNLVSVGGVPPPTSRV